MNRSIILHLEEIFDRQRIALLPMLSIFRDRGFYLAWGTALALIYGHRESEDFDFFTGVDFDPQILFDFCIEHFTGRSVVQTLISENTLWITVDDVKLSFFTLSRPLLEPLIITEYLDIASLRDIAAMKMGAIQGRATEKDYIDLAHMLDTLSIADLLSAFREKYGDIISESILLKSLVYFDDVIPAPIRILDQRYTWENSQKILTTKIREYITQGNLL
jgi:Nucleotidyl transferase AbiEii toxin, Type IV TA system